jgi:hypothetical protein
VLHEEPSVFVDQDIDYGSDWPDTLAHALHRSCHMLAIWSPSYFRSKWCVAEWETIRERERQAGLRTGGIGTSLIYPVVYSDGESFPPDAKRTQSRVDLHDYAYPYEQFKKSEKYLAFFDKITLIADELKTRLDSVPDWNAEWPMLKPQSVAIPQPQFARL